MPVKFIELAREGSFVSVERGSLCVTLDGRKKRIPFDIISGVLFTGYGQKITTNAINRLIENKSVVVFCDKKFNPSCICIPLAGHVKMMKNFNLQNKINIVFRKKMWKKIVSYKISNQSYVLDVVKNHNYELSSFSKNVKSGDKDNLEAKAAQIYWKNLFLKKHVRGDSLSSLNILLNYSYTVLRATIARQLYRAGLWPMFSVKHSNNVNPSALVDDLIEPFRPIVDMFIAVCEMKSDDELVLAKSYKYSLFDFLNLEIPLNHGRSSLHNLIEIYIYSYVVCLEEKNVDRLVDLDIDWRGYFKRIQSYVAASDI